MPMCPLPSDDQVIDISEEACIQISIIDFVYEKSRPLYSAVLKAEMFCNSLAGERNWHATAK